MKEQLQTGAFGDRDVFVAKGKRDRLGKAPHRRRRRTMLARKRGRKIY